MRNLLVAVFLSAVVTAAAPPEYDRARDLYQRTEYRRSLSALLPLQPKNIPTLQLTGQSYFMLGEYKKATEVLEQGYAIDPNNAELVHWLGRSYGRRAETANPFVAPGLAAKTRQMFERAVALDPSNKGAAGDLLDFYLEAPGFLGGGTYKAEALAQLIAKTDPAEGHYAQAVIDDKKKEYEAAEQQLRRAAELAPRQVGRILDLAKFLSKRGHIRESEQLFDQATRLSPNNPRVMFERANTYIREKRNLDDARQLLERFLRTPLTPDDPPRDRAQDLLNTAALKKPGA